MTDTVEYPVRATVRMSEIVRFHMRSQPVKVVEHHRLSYSNEFKLPVGYPFRENRRKMLSAAFARIQLQLSRVPPTREESQREAVQLLDRVDEALKSHGFKPDVE